MQSRVVSKGNRFVLEIELDHSEVDIDVKEAARAALAAHGLRPGSVEVVFLDADPFTSSGRQGGGRVKS